MAETLEPFDIESLTIGEVAQVQEASGLQFRQLIGPYRLMLALFVQRLRSSGKPPTAFAPELRSPPVALLASFVAPTSLDASPIIETRMMLDALGIGDTS